jgi:uncharacterized damage-inducible protein DinB
VHAKTYFVTMARYNLWMNGRIYDCAGQLSDAERKRDRGAFFKSIHGTLNHILLGDRLWLGRFSGEAFTGFSQLDDTLYADTRRVSPVSCATRPSSTRRRARRPCGSR